MLPEGIYEEIINQKLKNELSTMDSYEITMEKLDVEEARKMLASYISAVTRRALLFVRDGEKDDKEALLKQVQTCNEIITILSERLNDDEFKSLQIAEIDLFEVKQREKYQKTSGSQAGDIDI